MQAAWLLASLWLPASGASADDAAREDKRVVAAAKAFNHAQEAALSGDHARAAELFELADRIAPTPEALRSATRARLHAGELASSAGHAEELLRRYPSDEDSRELASQVLGRARPELTRYRLQCETPCTVVIDGLAVGLAPLKSQILYATPGSHEFEVSFEDGRERSMRLSGGRGEALSIRVQPPPPDKGPPPSAPTTKENSSGQLAEAETDTEAQPRAVRRRGLSSAWFWSAASLTAVAGGVALWSGLDLLEARDDFENRTDPTRAEFERGERKDLRTTALIATSATLAASTLALGFFTDFGGRRGEPMPTVAVMRDGAAVAVQTAF
ncbi:MAG: hypothetical protein ABW252_12320 [Polyangiales bacterium]